MFDFHLTRSKIRNFYLHVVYWNTIDESLFNCGDESTQQLLTTQMLIINFLKLIAKKTIWMHKY